MSKRSFALILLTAVLAVFPSLWGCGPQVSEEELGTVLNELPEVPGADEPFEMPELGPPPPPDPEFEGF